MSTSIPSALDHLDALAKNFDKILASSEGDLKKVFFQSIDNPGEAFVFSDKKPTKGTETKTFEVKNLKTTVSVSVNDTDSNLGAIRKLFREALKQECTAPEDLEKMQRVIEFALHCDHFLDELPEGGCEGVLREFIQEGEGTKKAQPEKSSKDTMSHAVFTGV